LGIRGPASKGWCSTLSGSLGSTCRGQPGRIARVVRQVADHHPTAGAAGRALRVRTVRPSPRPSLTPSRRHAGALAGSASSQGMDVGVLTSTRARHAATASVPEGGLWDTSDQGLSWRSCVGVIQAGVMVRRHELTGEARARVEPLLPEPGRRIGRWRDHRQVVTGICVGVSPDEQFGRDIDMERTRSSSPASNATGGRARFSRQIQSTDRGCSEHRAPPRSSRFGSRRLSRSQRSAHRWRRSLGYPDSRGQDSRPQREPPLRRLLRQKWLRRQVSKEVGTRVSSLFDGTPVHEHGEILVVGARYRFRWCSRLERC
jgi:hypothetical protein